MPVHAQKQNKICPKYLPNSETSLIIKMLSLIGLVPALKLVGKILLLGYASGEKGW